MTTDPADCGAADGDDADPVTGSPDATTYRVAVDLDRCDGVFACLVRDDRFVEADDGLVGFDPTDSVGSVERTNKSVTATFVDDRVDDARTAAAACPLDAITVEEDVDA